MHDGILPALVSAANSECLVKEIYGDLLKPGTAQIGKALSTVIGLGNTVLLPLALLNERASMCFTANVESYREKLETIPEEHINPVAPEIGVPIAEKFAYVEDVNLRELYTNLLAKASVAEWQSKAHPAFVQMISSLTPDEAVLLELFCRRSVVPYVWVNLLDLKDDKLKRKYYTFFRFPHLNSDRLLFEGNIDSYISNLEGLGIVKLWPNNEIKHNGLYDSIEKLLKEMLSQDLKPSDLENVVINRGRIESTPFGKLFLEACVVQPNDSAG